MAEEKNLKKERCFVMLKPDAVQRSLMGEIISRFERIGLKITAIKFFVADEQRVWDHYAKDDVWFAEKGQNVVDARKKAGLPIEKEIPEYGKDIIQQNVDYVTSGPVMALVIEGNSAVAIVKKLVGGTEPATSDVGTIRGDFVVDSYDLAGADERAVRNLLHCSDIPEEAEREIKLWMNEDDVINYRLVQEQILYDVNLDGILE